ncbi:MAG: CorA family divalent cation transporter [Butyribacter sp.]|nr:CorA family divalent cation transporter [bacterium]MDY3853365.1 CorA family divalent cation transporter [Butyribacter sp.]
MVYYLIQEDGIRKTDEKQLKKTDNGICILSWQEWQKNQQWHAFFGIWHTADNIHYCKVESYKDFLYGTVSIPAKSTKEEKQEFAFYYTKSHILLLDKDGKMEHQVQKLAQNTVQEEYTTERFLYDFLQSFVSEDLFFLETIEQKIAKIEEKVLQGNAEQFNYQMLPVKKIITRFYHYYSQLKEMSEELLDSRETFFGKEDEQRMRMYGERVCRLAGETKLLREYAMQVQEVYQSEIGLRQNNVMKMLTIVTTIFLPLSLIAGWYGMNFAFMPELQYRYAYPIVFIVSVLVVIISLLFFKKKHFW